MGRIVYSVRARVPAGDTLSQYLAWLSGENGQVGHVQEVVESGARCGRVMVVDDAPAPGAPGAGDTSQPGGTRVVVSEYEFADRASLDRYVQGPAVRLRAAGAARFGGTGITFERQVAEVVQDVPAKGGR